MSDIEEHIRKAYKEGQFDNLPGKGKPLKLDENPHEDPEWRLAYSMLKSSGFSLPWIETRREIESAIEQANTGLQAAWDFHQKEKDRGQAFAQAQAEWLHAVETYQQRISKINKNILDYNLSTPSPQFQMYAVDADDEIRRVTQSS